jgi:hypothetical protein
MSTYRSTGWPIRNVYDGTGEYEFPTARHYVPQYWVSALTVACAGTPGFFRPHMTTRREATRDQAAVSKPSDANRDVITLLHEIDEPVPHLHRGERHHCRRS